MAGKKRRASAPGARDRILDAALALFCERGYKGTTTRAIAERARVNEVTVFRQFGTKQGLFQAVIQRDTDVEKELGDFELRPSGDMVADLMGLGTEMQRRMASRSAFFKLLMTEVTRDPSLWGSISHAPFTILTMLERYFEEANRLGLARDVDPHVASVAFFSFFFRAMVARSFLGRDVFFEADEGTVEDFVLLFVNGIQREARG
jgi:AcrR family transcriptional regulator